MEQLLTMSKKELTRLEVMQRLAEKRLKQQESTEILRLSERHIRQLLRTYREHGESGLLSQVQETIFHLLRPFLEKLHTLTADNGKEFASHETSAAFLLLEFYFAHPYASW